MWNKYVVAMLLMCMVCYIAVADEEIVLDRGDYKIAIWETDWERFASVNNRYETPEALLENAADMIDSIVEITGHKNWRSAYSENKIMLESTTEGTHIYGGYFSNQSPKPYVYLESDCMQHSVAAITHELTHIVCQHYSSLSLREGLAQYMNWLIGGQEDMILFELNPHLVFQNIVRASKTNEPYLFEVGRFDNTKKLALWIKSGKSAAFYIASYSFAKYLIENYSMDTYMAIYGAASEESYIIETGKPLEVLQKEWLANTEVFEGKYSHQDYLADISVRLIEHGYDEVSAQRMSTAILSQLE